jgi:hypothetical protein
MPSPAEQIANLLETLGVCGNDTGWTTFIGQMGIADKCVLVLDQPGRGSEVGIAIDYPAIQVLVRTDREATAYSYGHAKAEIVFEQLHAAQPYPAEFPTLVSCLIRGGIAPLGKDDLGRHQFSINFDLITAPQGVGMGNRTEPYP